MKVSRLIIIALTLMVALVSCRKDKFVDQKEIIPPTGPSVEVITDVNGVIKDVNGEPIMDAVINIGTKTTNTDERGVFLIQQIALLKSGTKVEILKDGYFTNYRIVYPNKPNERVFVEVKMTSRGVSTVLSSDQGGLVTMNGNATVLFEPNSFLFQNGDVYDGEVSVYSYWYDPTSIELALNSPAALEAIDKDGKLKVLATFGMIAVEMYSNTGEKLEIDPTQKAELTFPIPTSLEGDAPSEIPLWSVNETSGKWIEEGSATKQEGKYIGKVSHFSFWNCDIPNDFITLEGILMLDSGDPLGNYLVQIQRGNLEVGFGTTNNVGYFTGKVPNDEVLTLIIENCGEEVVNMPIGPFSMDTDMGNVLVELNDYVTTITATLKGCTGEALPFAYGISSTGTYIGLDDLGGVNYVLMGCTNEPLSVVFYDIDNLNASDEISIDVDVTHNNLGEIILCNQILEYISISIGGGDHQLIANPEAYIINGEKLTIFGLDAAIGASMRFDMATLDLGENMPSRVEVNTYDLISTNDLVCGYDFSDVSCESFDVNVTEIDMDLLIVSGTFEGLLQPFTGPDGVFVTGSFRCPIVDQFNEASVSGRIWFDLDGNGIRDANEEELTLVGQGAFSIEFPNGGYHIFGDYFDVVNEDGLFELNGCRPGSYEIVCNFISDYSPTLLHIGNEELDNDFIVGTGIIKTATIIIEDGQSLNNIDLGLLPSNNISIVLDKTGCDDDPLLKCTIVGGLAPYIVTVDNGDSYEGDDHFIIFNVENDAQYEVTVIDALGNTHTNTLYVNVSTHVVLGNVWIDGNENNLFDTDSDYGVIGVDVELYNTSNELISTTQASGIDDSFYVFSTVPHGEYYIKATVMNGFSLVDQNLDLPNGSYVDPVTYKSELFTLEDCDIGDTRIHIGYKQD